MSFADCVGCGVKSRMANVLLKPEVTDQILDIDTEQKMLLNRIVQ